MILVHVKDMMVQNDCKSIQIRTVNTDVVVSLVIILALMPYLKFHDDGVEVLIDFGTGDHRIMISFNRSFESLGYSFTKALLPCFHSTSSFFGKTKARVHQIKKVPLRASSPSCSGPCAPN